jgi:DNA-binding XRE family transcriptional regulator
MLDPNQIRQARYALSLSQHELARRASISRTALNQFERGNYNAGPNFCRKLRDYFETDGIHLEELAEPPADRQSTEQRPQSPLVYDATQTHNIEVSHPEDVGHDRLGPIEILLGVGLSLILGRRIGF